MAKAQAQAQAQAQTHRDLEDGKPSIGFAAEGLKLALSLALNLLILIIRPHQLQLQLGHLHERFEILCQVAHAPQVVPHAHGDRVTEGVVVRARLGGHRRLEHTEGFRVAELVDPRGQRCQRSLQHAALVLVVGAGLEVLLQLVPENVVDQVHLHRRAHEEHRAAVMHAVRHICAHVLDRIGPKVRDVLEGRENDGTAVLVPERLAHVCIGAALNVLDIGNAEAARQDEGHQLVRLGLCLPPPVHVDRLCGRVVVDVDFPVLVHLLRGERLQRERLLERLGRELGRHRQVCWRLRRRLRRLAALRLGDPPEHRDHARENRLAADGLPRLARRAHRSRDGCHSARGARRGRPLPQRLLLLRRRPRGLRRWLRGCRLHRRELRSAGRPAEVRHRRQQGHCSDGRGHHQQQPASLRRHACSPACSPACRHRPFLSHRVLLNF